MENEPPRKPSSLIGQKILHRTQKYLEVAGDVADAVIRLRDNPGAVDYIAVGLKFVQSAADSVSDNLYSYFGGRNGWLSLEEWGLSEDLIKVLSSTSEARELARCEDYFLMQTKIPGVDQEEVVGWLVEGEYKGGPHIRLDRREQSIIALGRAVWEFVGGNAIELISAGHKEDAPPGSSGSILRKDNSRNSEVYESQLSINILERIKLFRDKKVKRSIMLLGPAGTGKTSIVKYVANSLNLMSLRVSSGDLGKINSRDIVKAVELLKPNLLIIDDFDRFYNAHFMLSELEQVNNSVEIFMVTVNSTENLDAAVLRPGRFDEIIDVVEIDPNIVEKLLGDVSEELAETLKSWPVAFIAEFHKRRQVLGDEEAVKELGEFKARISDLLEEKEQEKEE